MLYKKESKLIKTAKLKNIRFTKKKSSTDVTTNLSKLQFATKVFYKLKFRSYLFEDMYPKIFSFENNLKGC